MEKLIKELPEVIFFDGRREKAFLEITGSHVYYCTHHDNRGNLNCAFVACGELYECLEKALDWVKNGIEKGEILAV